MLKATILGLCFAGLSGIGVADAAHAKHPRHASTPPVASADAVDLAILAPPARASTAMQTYGDAAFARSRMQRRDARSDVVAPSDTAVIPFGIDSCEPRAPGPAGYRCQGDPTRPGYGQDYAFTPANASAPQVPRYDPGAQSGLLPSVTALFWAVNAARLDPHN